MKLIKINAPTKYRKRFREILNKRGIKESFKLISEDDGDYYELIIDDSLTEKIIDELEKTLHINDSQKKKKDKGTISIIKVESFLPSHKSLQKSFLKSQRISSEEIIKKVEDSTNLNLPYIVFMFLSSIIAGIGLYANNPVITIGAMIISPLVGPILGFSLSNVIEDKNLLEISILSLTIGLLISIGTGFLITQLSPHPKLTEEILLRTHTTLLDLGLALSAGAAGALALFFEAGLSIAGVAIAVALLPPAVVVGIGLGLSNTQIFLGSLFLLITNLIALIFISTLLFWLLGIKKGEKELGKKQQEKIKKKVKKIIYILVLLTITLTYITVINLQNELNENRIIDQIQNQHPNIEITEIIRNPKTKNIILEITTTTQINNQTQKNIQNIINHKEKENYEITLKITNKQELHLN